MMTTGTHPLADIMRSHHQGELEIGVDTLTRLEFEQRIRELQYELQSTQGDFQSYVLEKKEDLIKLKRIIKGLLRERRDLESKVRLLNKGIQAGLRLRQNLLDENTNLNHEIKELNQIRNRTKIISGSLDDIFKVINGGRDQLMREKNLLKKRLDELAQRFECFPIRRDEYISKEEAEIRESEMLDLSGLCPEYRSALEVMIKYCQEMKHSLQNAQAKLTKSRQDINNLENQMREKDANHETKIHEFKKEIDHKIEELKETKNQLNQLVESELRERNRVSILQSSFEEAKSECLRIRTTLENVMLSHSQLQHGVEILETELANKDVKLTKLNQEKLESQESHKALTNKLEEMKKKVFALTDEEQNDTLKLKKTIRELKENNAKLTSTVHSTLQENTKLKKKLQQSEDLVQSITTSTKETNLHLKEEDKYITAHWRSQSFDKRHQKIDHHSVDSCPPRLLDNNMPKCLRSGDTPEVVETEKCIKKLSSEDMVTQTEKYDGYQKNLCDYISGDGISESDPIQESNYSYTPMNQEAMNSLTTSAMNKVEAITEKAQRALENTQKTMNRLSVYMDLREDAIIANPFPEEAYDFSEFNSQIQYLAGDSDAQQPLPVPRNCGTNQSMNSLDLLPKRFLMENIFNMGDSHWSSSPKHDSSLKGQKEKNLAN